MNGINLTPTPLPSFEFPRGEGPKATKADLSPFERNLAEKLLQNSTVTRDPETGNMTIVNNAPGSKGTEELHLTPTELSYAEQQAVEALLLDSTVTQNPETGELSIAQKNPNLLDFGRSSASHGLSPEARSDLFKELMTPRNPTPTSLLAHSLNAFYTPKA